MSTSKAANFVVDSGAGSAAGAGWRRFLGRCGDAASAAATSLTAVVRSTIAAKAPLAPGVRGLPPCLSLRGTLVPPAPPLPPLPRLAHPTRSAAPPGTPCLPSPARCLPQAASHPPSSSPPRASVTEAATMPAASVFFPAAAMSCAAAWAGTRTPLSDASTPTVHSVLAQRHATATCSSGARSSCASS
eukprot:2405099-Pleurochrysis_carterae.AAC.1